MKAHYGHAIKRAHGRPPEHSVLLTAAYGQNTVAINYIQIPWWCRKQGHGGRLMQEVIRDADLERMNLTLTVCPFGRKGVDMDASALAAWYERLGFKDYNGLYMRSPDWSVVSEVAPIPIRRRVSLAGG